MFKLVDEKREKHEEEEELGLDQEIKEIMRLKRYRFSGVCLGIRLEF